MMCIFKHCGMSIAADQQFCDRHRCSATTKAKKRCKSSVGCNVPGHRSIVKVVRDFKLSCHKCNNVFPIAPDKWESVSAAFIANKGVCKACR